MRIYTLLTILLLVPLTPGTYAPYRHDANPARAVVSVTELMLQSNDASAWRLAERLGTDIQRGDGNKVGYAYTFRAKNQAFDRGYLADGFNTKNTRLSLELGVASGVQLRISDLVRLLGQPVIVRRFDYEPEAKWVYHRHDVGRYATISARMGGRDDEDQLPPDLTMRTYVITITVKEASGAVRRDSAHAARHHHEKFLTHEGEFRLLRSGSQAGTGLRQEAHRNLQHRKQEICPASGSRLSKSCGSPVVT